MAMADVLVEGKLVVVDNCLIQNGHHLSVVREDLVKFCGRHSTQICFASATELTLCLWKASGLRSTPVERGLLVAANIVSNLPDAVTSDTPHVPAALRADTTSLTVYCSDNFCNTFGFTHHEHVIFRLCANVPDIERVILGAATEDALKWASTESFRRKLNDLLYKRTLLCMVGCSFGAHVGCSLLENQSSLWDCLTVVSCIPVCQGRLTEATEIVVKCYTQQHSMSHSCEDSGRNCKSNHCNDVAKPVMVSDFAADVGSSSAPFTLEICLSRLQNSLHTHELDVIVLMNIVRIRSLVCLQQSQNFDEFSVIVFSRQCAARLGIMNGNVLELQCKLQHDLRRMAAIQHKVLIACVDTTQSSNDSMACMSSCAWFNLHSIPSLFPDGNICETKPCFVKKVCHSRSPGQSQSCTMCVEDLQFANEVVISCIHCSHYSAAASHDRLLRDHFSSRR